VASSFPWLKLWNEALEDAKFDAAADMAGSTPAVATVAFLRACTYANEHDRKNGSFAGLNLQVIASRLRVPLAEIKRLFDAYRELGMVIGQKLLNWTKRQLEKIAKPRSAAAERQARRRQKLAEQARQPELELPPSPQALRHAQTVHPGVTPAVDTEEECSEAVASESIVATAPNEFEEFWARCPRKVGKGLARKAYIRARRTADWNEIMSGILRYAAECDGREPRFIKHPATWLSAECWNDEPMPITFDHVGEADGRRPLSRSEQRVIDNRRVIAAVFGELLENAA
jgi:hypothetical protein